MKGIHLVFRDLKMMWHHKHGRIALVFLLIVPLIYSGFFLAGYWNPYGRLDQLPVAVVNLDQGGMMNNKSIEAGQEFVKNLKENKDLKFSFLSENAANQGLKDGTYYMVLTIPKDFSQKISTLMDEHPVQANLHYKINPGKNFVASQISTTATEKMKTKIAASITKSYADGVFSKFIVLADGLREAGDGASKINQGTMDAKNGMILLSDGVHRLNDGAKKLEDGSQQLSTGQEKLKKGLDGLKDGSHSLSNGIELLSQGHTTLKSGMEQLSKGMQSFVLSSEKLSQGQEGMKDKTDHLTKAVEQFIKHHPEMQDDPTFQQIAAMSTGLSKAADSLSSGQAQLAQGANQLVQSQEKIQDGMNRFGNKMDEAANGAKKLSEGTIQFSNGFSQWKNGFSSLNTGINDLANGGNKLDNGTNQLVDGLSQLTVGSDKLASKLNDAALQTSSIHNNDQLTSMFSEPVKLIESDLSEVPNYGTGISPYFLSLAFYVGGIMAANILPLGRRQDLLVNGTQHYINKLGLKYSIALIQVLIVDLVVLFGFKIHVASVPLFILSSVIVSFTFMTFILMLVTLFGVAGKFMAVTLLVLQLATCGGTFPGELSNPVLSKIGSILPMSHSLQSFQDVISLGNWAQLQQQLLILLIYLVIAGVIGWVTSHLQHAKQSGELSL
ncbi:YhgE/Pip domain-containing protein [Bacillus sp. sid0103]|uniref:YhgE/Pip family protein n=1 Tax=Bacillus sp. sid0103 TaxID=2856337 RepID=UPI001C44CB2B|nr:YhgE/Pip domain-containing protein [Bacillus sp. sid0103]MBV7507324.1 YhgE/Pip domain-containing protein [Bacillus sp. sid0103]